MLRNVDATFTGMLQELRLKCGQTLPNRLAKAAMTERVAGANHNPNRYHVQLYKQWAANNPAPGLMISGNIMIDRSSLESAGNVVLEDDRGMTALRQWTSTAKSGGSKFWAQISHSGRQTSRLINLHPRSASAVQLHEKGLYGKPRALSEKEIQDLIGRFARTASLCVEGGFDGVQVHAAHGYLLSQFLSPITNQRTDDWGGSLENRARFLLEAVRAVRKAVGANVALAVKLNSADFQKGGFDQGESLQVAEMLEKEGIDLLEISGGNYESPSFLLNDGVGVRESTKRREAYFIDFARDLRKKIKTPLMITGGFRSRAFCDETLKNGDTDMIGMGRPFLISPTFAQDFLSGALSEVELPVLKPMPAFGLMSEAGWYAYQIARRLSRGKAPKWNLGAFHSVSHILWHETWKSMAHRIAG
ncbi:MAG: NADH:flavin oxidoreductase/NADH oxidase family protein [Leptospiraceae bacterium]|nr:NADH:flavin oxidoreductase/NADH oxidase family protein [Leptospiraceae bacterium]